MAERSKEQPLREERGSFPVALYDYQADMLRRTWEALFPSCASEGGGGGAGRSVMVQMPTGTGKTVLMCALVRSFVERTGRSVWVVAHRRELVEQACETLSRFGIATSGGKELVGGDAPAVRVMSVQGLAARIGQMDEQPGLIVVDEAHHALADTYRRLWRCRPAALKVGLTATPCRLRKEGFTPLFDRLLLSESIGAFIRRGRLSVYDYVVIGLHSAEQAMIDGLEKRGADGDYSVSEMGRKLNVPAAVERLYRSVEQYAAGRKGIVYAVDVAHAASIAACYCRHGLRAAAIDGKTPSELRRRAVADFKAGRLDCLVNVNLFDEGFDCPDVEYIQMARPTLSLAKYMQMVGRGLRRSPGKRLCVLLDNAGLCRMFGLPDAERDWRAMFLGERAGRGVPRKGGARGCQADDGMEVVVCHSRQELATPTDKARYFRRSEPFEQGGRWGLRVGDDVVLRPVYREIGPFVGDFAAFEFIPRRWGVLSRDGRQFLPPCFQRVELLEGGDAVLYKTNYLKRRVHLATTLTDERDLREWWHNGEGELLLSEMPRLAASRVSASNRARLPRRMRKRRE